MKDQLHMKTDVGDECALEIIRRYLRSRRSIYIRSDRQAAVLYAIHSTAETILMEHPEYGQEQGAAGTAAGTGVPATGSGGPSVLTGAGPGYGPGPVPDQPGLDNGLG